MKNTTKFLLKPEHNNSTTHPLIYSIPSRYNFTLAIDRLKPLEVTGISVVVLEIEVEIETELEIYVYVLASRF